jgi:NAD(P)-dependent dehydrogenase (short-subunit alcohol dehydrogenase family)
VGDDTEALHVLINNAGVSGGNGKDTFEAATLDRLTRTFQVNAAGPHLMAQAFADLLETASEAAVLNVTSQLGSIAHTNGGTWQSYKMSKAALNMATRLQAGALDAHVTVVALHPGWVQTDMGGPNARVSPEDSVAGMVEVLVSLDASHNGAFLTFEGDTLPW